MSLSIDSNEIEFKRMYAHAVGLYPNPGVHEGSSGSYWNFLKPYSIPVLRVAFRQACSSSPEFFPSAVKIRECAEAAAKTAAYPRLATNAPALLPAGRERVPAIGAGHEEWVNEGANEGERLARLWQVESKHHGWDREVPMPEEVGKRRFQELSKVLEAIGQRTARTSGQRRTGSDSQWTASGLSGSRPPGESSGARRSHGASCTCEICFAPLWRKAQRIFE